MMNYDKLTKKELICTLIARDEMLKNCRERFELHKTTDANTIQDQSDLIDVLNKALELACDCFYNNFGKTLEPYCECNTSSEAMQKHFKIKAKEMMRND